MSNFKNNDNLVKFIQKHFPNIMEHILAYAEMKKPKQTEDNIKYLRDCMRICLESCETELRRCTYLPETPPKNINF